MQTVYPSKPKPITQTIQLGNPLLPPFFLEIQLIVCMYLEQDLQNDSKNKRLQTKTLKWEGKRHAAVGRESREGNCWPKKHTHISGISAWLFLV